MNNINRSFAATLVALCLSTASTAHSQILPTNRTADWSVSGVPGGIPNRTTLCANLAAGATQSQIQSALNACPANQVVQLAAGTYNVPGGLTIPSNVVLRGAGPKQTILSASGSNSGFIRFGSGAVPTTSSSVTITGGSTAKSSAIVLQNAAAVTVGSYLMVTQLNDSSYVSNTTTNGTCNWCDGGIGWNGTRLQGQIVEVVAVSGNTVGISPGLFVDYTRSPLATPVNVSARNAGVENLQVVMNNTGFTANFRMEGVVRSWIKNVESNYTDGDHVQMQWSYRNEIRDSIFHNGFTHSPGNTESSIFIANKSTGVLVENNVLRRLHAGVMLNWGAAGNVIAYNYFDGNFDSAGFNSLFPSISLHGAHPMFNLFEGNVGAKFDADFYWGSSSHSVLFRNWFKGATQIWGPLTGRGPEQTSGAYWASQALAAIDISQTARHYSLIGNVVGSDWQKSLGKWTPLVVAPTERSYYTTNNPFGYTFGYANLSDSGGNSGNNNLPFTTAIIHGDYDYVTGLTRWDANIATRALPASMYKPAKPSWFGSMPWPALGPDTGNFSAATIPAKACFDEGKMPSCRADGTVTPPAALQPPTNLKIR